MKKYLSLAFVLLTAISCTKVEKDVIKDCIAVISFNRIDTKSNTHGSMRVYNYYCSDLKAFEMQTRASFKRDEPTATKVKYYKVYSK